MARDCGGAAVVLEAVARKMALHDTGTVGAPLAGFRAPLTLALSPRGEGKKGRKAGVSSSPSPHLSPWERSPQDVGVRARERVGVRGPMP